MDPSVAGKVGLSPRPRSHSRRSGLSQLEGRAAGISGPQRGFYTLGGGWSPACPGRKQGWALGGRGPSGQGRGVLTYSSTFQEDLGHQSADNVQVPTLRGDAHWSHGCPAGAVNAHLDQGRPPSARSVETSPSKGLTAMLSDGWNGIPRPESPPRPHH